MNTKREFFLLIGLSTYLFYQTIIKQNKDFYWKRRKSDYNMEKITDALYVRFGFIFVQ